MVNASPQTLVAVLTNPPVTDGKRTLRRVDLAAELLGFDHVTVANLFALPSHATGAITDLGVTEDGSVAGSEVDDLHSDPRLRWIVRQDDARVSSRRPN